jgi:RNA recognition motif-containing protein
MGDAQVFIARLPRDTRADDLEEVFKKYGPLTRCDVRSGEF